MLLRLKSKITMWFWAYLCDYIVILCLIFVWKCWWRYKESFHQLFRWNLYGKRQKNVVNWQIGVVSILYKLMISLELLKKRKFVVASNLCEVTKHLVLMGSPLNSSKKIFEHIQSWLHEFVPRFFFRIVLWTNLWMPLTLFSLPKNLCHRRFLTLRLLAWQRVSTKSLPKFLLSA